MLSTFSANYPAKCAAIAVLMILAGCTTVETTSFRTTGNSNVDSAYIATDADFSRYNQLLVDDMGIFFPTSTGLPENELARIREIFREAFLSELAGYQLTQESGPDMLRVSASLIDLRNASYSEIPDIRRDLREYARPGKLLFLMELKDSGTGKVLARAGDSQAAPRFATGANTEIEWNSVEDAAQHWASLFRQFLDQNLNP